MRKFLPFLIILDIALLAAAIILWRYNAAGTAFDNSSLPPGVQLAFYVSPDGSDLNPGSPDKPFATLYKARDAARLVNHSMTGDILIYLRKGTYVLDSTFSLTSIDNGSSGHNIIYSAYNCENAVISGGSAVKGWVVSDPVKNIYRAYAGPHTDTRQLYVNGLRAIRARSIDASGWTENPIAGDGYDCPTSVAQWKNINHVEVVSLYKWKNHRGSIASVSGGHAVMAQPYWDLAHRQEVAPPSWIENAYELLDEEGEWWLDYGSDSIYYKPRKGEDMTAAEVIVPHLETLVQGSGVNNVQFIGLQFSYARWVYPNSTHGFACLQSDALYNDGAESSLQLPAAVRFDHCRQIVFERNIFAHLGADGLQLFRGCKNNLAFNNELRDISGTAVSIGSFTDASATTNDLVKDNIIDQNAISGPVEYLSCVGIFIGYTDHTVITHNHLRGLPYSGISMGWGWSNSPTIAKNNEIGYNRIDSAMSVLHDGGAIYTLSDQPGARVHDNFINSPIHEAGGLYPDEGSSHMHWYNNVAQNAPRWLQMWIGTIQYDTVNYNYYDSGDSVLNGTNCVVENNVRVSGGAWPLPAIAIMNAAGIPGESATGVSVKGLCMDPEALVLSPGESYTLHATILPDNATVQAVSWSSDNNAVISVNSTGVITANAKGVATITARTLDRNIPATCLVNVIILKKPWSRYLFICFIVISLIIIWFYYSCIKNRH